MEQTKNPVDVGASIPDKEKPYADLITLLFDSSILAPLSIISDQLTDDVVEFSEWGMTRNEHGVFLTFLLVIPDGFKTVYIPANSALVLMSCICGAARPGEDPRAYQCAVTAGPAQ